MLKPEFIPPPQQQGFYDFKRFLPNGIDACPNTTCQWNKKNNTCSDFSVPFPDDNFVYPVLPGELDDSSRFDIYSRMRACAKCNDAFGQHPSSPSPRHYSSRFAC
jgi:hypothetical protein